MIKIWLLVTIFGPPLHPMEASTEPFWTSAACEDARGHMALMPPYVGVTYECREVPLWPNLSRMSFSALRSGWGL